MEKKFYHIPKFIALPVGAILLIGLMVLGVLYLANLIAVWHFNEFQAPFLALGA